MVTRSTLILEIFVGLSINVVFVLTFLMIGHFSVLGQHEVKSASFASWVGELERIVQFCPFALVKGNRCSWLFTDVNICYGLFASSVERHLRHLH